MVNNDLIVVNNGTSNTTIYHYLPLFTTISSILSAKRVTFVSTRWFKTKWAAWQKLFNQWQSKQMEYRNKVQKKAAEKAQPWQRLRSFLSCRWIW